MLKVLNAKQSCDRQKNALCSPSEPLTLLMNKFPASWCFSRRPVNRFDGIRPTRPTQSTSCRGEHQTASIHPATRAVHFAADDAAANKEKTGHTSNPLLLKAAAEDDTQEEEVRSSEESPQPQELDDFTRAQQAKIILGARSDEPPKRCRSPQATLISDIKRTQPSDQQKNKPLGSRIRCNTAVCTNNAAPAPTPARNTIHPPCHGSNA